MITAKLTKRPTLKAVVTKPYQGKGYAEGYEDGLEKGYANGEADATAAAEAHNAHILADCNEVLPTKGVETAESLEQVPQRIGEIAVTEDMLRYCGSVNILGLGVFDKEEVVLNLDVATNIYRLVSNTAYSSLPYPCENTKVKHLVVNCKRQVTSLMQMLHKSDSILERLTLNVDTSKATTTRQMFHYQSALKIIDGTPLDLSSSTENSHIVYVCQKLEEIRFAPNTIKASIAFQHSSLLSDATIQSIVDGLAEVSTAQTLTLHNTVGNKLTDAQKATITAKNWTLVY